MQTNTGDIANTIPAPAVTHAIRLVAHDDIARTADELATEGFELLTTSLTGGSVSAEDPRWATLLIFRRVALGAS